jgi:hypothetical protein
MNINFGRCQPSDDAHGRPWPAPRSRKVYPMNVYLIPGARKVRGMIVASVACWAALFGCVAAAAETKPLRLQIDQDVSMEVRGHTIATYRATPSPNRPFLRELWTPGGVQVLRDSPHDHKHHHGMMFALSVDGIDFWCDEPTCGRQVPKALEEVQVGGVAGTSRVGFTQPVDWVAPSGTVSLHERRTITAFADPTISATLLTWRSCLSAADARPVKLGGTDYVGLGTRFVVSMDGKGRFFNSAGQEGSASGPDGAGIGNKRVTPAKWCAYTATADNQPVTIALFNHPRCAYPGYCLHIHPGFAFLGATLGVDVKPIEVKPGAALDLRFGAALWDGEIDRGRVEVMYQKWVELEP